MCASERILRRMGGGSEYCDGHWEWRCTGFSQKVCGRLTATPERLAAGITLISMKDGSQDVLKFLACFVKE